MLGDGRLAPRSAAQVVDAMVCMCAGVRGGGLPRQGSGVEGVCVGASPRRDREFQGSCAKYRGIRRGAHIAASTGGMKPLRCIPPKPPDFTIFATPSTPRPLARASGFRATCPACSGEDTPSPAALTNTDTDTHKDSHPHGKTSMGQATVRPNQEHPALGHTR